MPDLVSFAEYQKLIKVAEDAGLGAADVRLPLFARIQDIRRRIPEGNAERARVINDISALNQYVTRPGQIPPLIVYLENAIVIVAGTASEEYFQELIDKHHPGEPALDGGKSGSDSGGDEFDALPEYQEAITFRDDMVPFGYLEAGRQAGLSVARLLVPRYDNDVDSGKGYWGTAWLLSDTELITNHHVLNARDRGEPAASDSDFALQALHTGIQFDMNSEDANSPVMMPAGLGKSDKDLDFAVLKIPQINRKPLTIRKTPFAVKKKDYIALNIIQHPRGGAKKIALRNNLATRTTATDVRYFTDTLPGSSGSPVFDDDWNVVALHRGSKAVNKIEFQGRKTGVLNIGTLMSAILPKLR